jgi:hypothetical protein
MEVLTWKVRISVLWLFCAVAMSAGMVLGFMEPGVIEEVMAGEMSVGVLLFMSLLWLIPLVMAFLSLTLKDAVNRWANIILGIVFAVFHIVNVIRVTMTGELPVGALLIALSMIVAPALIAWHAWKWPTQEA